MPFNFQEIKGIQVVLEGGASNLLVGILTKNKQKFRFEYEKNYLRSKKAISLGPEMPITRRIYESEKLFEPFLDRIPSKENPAYSEYCKFTGISTEENDPFILLSTIASRGPSALLFKPIYNENFIAADLKEFRKNLNLTTREFAACFDFSQAGITRVETGKTTGGEILKRVEIYALYPEVTIDQLKRRAAYLHQKKLEHTINYLKGMPTKSNF